MRGSWMRALVVACVLPVAAYGQDTAASPDPRLAATFSALRPPARLRIVTQGVHVGDFRAFDADSVRLDQREGVRLIALRDIRTVSRSTRRVGKGALIGTITGGLLVGAMGYGLAHAFCDSASCDDGAAGAVFGGAIGAGAGALIGAGIGALVPGWRVVYARPQ